MLQPQFGNGGAVAGGGAAGRHLPPLAGAFGGSPGAGSPHPHQIRPDAGAGGEPGGSGGRHGGSSGGGLPTAHPGAIPKTLARPSTGGPLLEPGGVHGAGGDRQRDGICPGEKWPAGAEQLSRGGVSPAGNGNNELSL